jgi:hypothetical protein
MSLDKLIRIEKKVDKLLRLREEELSLDDELKRCISADIVRHVLHELEYGRNVTAGKDFASDKLKDMFYVWKKFIPQEERDRIIQEWIEWGVGAIKSRGL